jgi:hypothetical protein
MSPCQRSLAKLRAEGWTCAITERWNQFAKVRQDLFGFCDVLCMLPSRGFLAVQTTSGDHVAERIAKIKAEPRAGIFLASGGKIQVHGWRKVGPRGQRKLWECRIENL